MSALGTRPSAATCDVTVKRTRKRPASGPADASCAIVSSTCQAKLSVSSGGSSIASVSSVTVIEPRPKKKQATRSVPGSAPGIARAVASPIAMRRSSMSSIGEVEARGQAGGRRADDRRVGALGGKAELDVGAMVPGVV